MLAAPIGPPMHLMRCVCSREAARVLAVPDAQNACYSVPVARGPRARGGDSRWRTQHGPETRPGP